MIGNIIEIVLTVATLMVLTVTVTALILAFFFPPSSKEPVPLTDSPDGSSCDG